MGGEFRAHSRVSLTEVNKRILVVKILINATNALRNCFCSLCVSFLLVTLASMLFSSFEYLEEIVFVSEEADPRGIGKCLNNLCFNISLA